MKYKYWYFEQVIKNLMDLMQHLLFVIYLLYKQVREIFKPLLLILKIYVPVIFDTFNIEGKIALTEYEQYSEKYLY